MTRWNLEKVKEEALKYENKNDFIKSSHGAYTYAKRNNILEEVCSHFGVHPYFWTLERAQKEAEKYTSRSQFKKNSPAYTYAAKNHIIEEVCKSLPLLRNSWTIEKVYNEALKYNHRSDFQKYSNAAYKWSYKKKILDDICAHMEIKYKKHFRDIYRNRNTILYYVKINKIYKIGVTIHEKYEDPKDSILKQRYNRQKLAADNSIEIIDYKLHDNGEIAYLNEQEIIKMYKGDKYIGERFITGDGRSGGETECFTRNIYEDIKYYFN